ncbi:MAG: S8 family serine peptidase, partial [Candidatus Dormibacteria bacterium]
MPELGHKLFGVTWDYRSSERPRRDHLGRTLTVALGTVAAVAVPLQASAAPAPSIVRATGASSSVIVRAAPGREPAAETAVTAAGGSVGLRFALINGFAASVPRAALAELRADSDISAITANGSGHLMDVTNYDPATDLGSISSTTAKYGAQKFWAAGFTGKGVDVALIDSGVAPVNGLTAAGKVVNGPDLSFESQNPAQTYLDTYGHGTHMAGIIAGRDTEATGAYAGDTSHFIGMAPDARIISIKVADAHGVTDISQMLAAIDWVVQHRNDNGMNIRVLNLSYGTDSQQPYSTDPLAYAAEVAWKNGIMVIAAAGNQGSGSKFDGLADPAYDPTVLAVGASQSNDSVIGDDTVPSFSSIAVGNRRPDLVAPGTHIQSLRDPGSYIDQTYGATGGITPRFFRGSGTSQATAAASGAAALIFSQHPNATPDQVKALLNQTATHIPGGNSASGNG